MWWRHIRNIFFHSENIVSALCNPLFNFLKKYFLCGDSLWHGRPICWKTINWTNILTPLGQATRCYNFAEIKDKICPDSKDCYGFIVPWSAFIFSWDGKGCQEEKSSVELFFLDDFCEYIHPLKHQNLGLRGFWINIFFFLICSPFFTEPDQLFLCLFKTCFTLLRCLFVSLQNVIHYILIRCLA